jgi:hypothetical protein
MSFLPLRGRRMLRAIVVSVAIAITCAFALPAQGQQLAAAGVACRITPPSGRWIAGSQVRIIEIHKCKVILWEEN